jgi:two-component system phosphate regulon response regulator PhoB
MKRLLLVEDEFSLGETLRERLEREGYEVIWAETQEGAENAVALNPNFDLIILDVGLPDGSGFDFARKVKEKRTTPFIFVTAMNSAEHRLEGYEIGAEEYIPKPFHLKELLMRIRHVLNTHPVHSNQVQAGDRVIDLDAQAIVAPNGEREFLPARDFQLLKLLLQLSPKVVSRDEILDQVWGEDRYPNHRTIDNAVVRLRQALGDAGGKYIRSVRGVGYQWTTENAQ